MIRRTLAALRSLRGNGRPDDLDALIVATAEPFPATDLAPHIDAMNEPLEPEFDRTFHRLISELVEGMAAVRAARHAEDWQAWAREMEASS